MKDRLIILQGDCLKVLKGFPDNSVHCCVTSPPYWGLRDYGCADQLGLEATPELFVAKMVDVFGEVYRVLREDGTLWLNLGDSYFGDSPARKSSAEGFSKEWDPSEGRGNGGQRRSAKRIGDLKPKDLCGIPWMVAFALRSDGWYLRSDIIWHKPAPMPESVTDRCTRSHEYMFMFAKSERYFYDADAIKERSAESSQERANYGWNGRTGDTKGALTVGARTGSTLHKMKNGEVGMEAMCPTMVNKRDVWSVQTSCCKEAHFATFPPDLIKPCILAGCPVGGVVLDPFFGSGTTGMVALELGRKAIGIELNPDYIELAKRRCDVTPGLALA